METLQLGDIFIYRKGKTPGPEAIVFAHGSYKGNSFGKAKVPSGAQLFFYIFHGVAVNDQPVRMLESGGSPAPNSLAEFKVDGELKKFMNLGAGQVTSIAGPDSYVYDYRLTFNEKSESRKRNILKAWQGGAHNNDLILIDQQETGRVTHLSDLFKALASFNIKYKKIHYTACRSPKGKDDLLSNEVNAAKALVKLCGK